MKPKIFYGWWVIGALVLTLMISSGTGFYCFGVFMEPVKEDFGWTKAQVTWIITVYWIVSAFSAPILGRLIDIYGARKVMLFATILNGDGGLNGKQRRPLEADEPKEEQSISITSGISLSQALRTPTYWLIAASFFLVPAAVFGTLAHQTSYIESLGISREAASLALGFTAGMGILGKIFFGFIAERMHVKYATILCFGIQALGIVILMATRTMGMVWLFVIVYGFSMGGMAVLRPLVIMDFFGTTAIGAILGSTSLIFSLGSASGPLYAAYIYDFFQNYYWAFLIYILAYLCAVTMICVAPVAKKPQLSLERDFM